MGKNPAIKFTDLTVWQKAHHFVLDVYRLSAGFPGTEVYGLTSQFRRAAVSVPANIAEGFRRQTRAEKVLYLNIAQSSLEECRYYLILANDLGYGRADQVESELEEVSKLLQCYSKAIRNDDAA